MPDDALPTYPLPDELRVSLYTLTGFLSGFVLTVLPAANRASLRFLAENVHRLPVTKQGWYWYHKQKNYRIMIQAGRESSKAALKVAALTGGFGILEVVSKNIRKRDDWANPMIAGANSSIAFAFWNRFPLMLFGRSVLIGGGAGAAVGKIQEWAREKYVKPQEGPKPTLKATGGALAPR